MRRHEQATSNRGKLRGLIIIDWSNFTFACRPTYQISAALLLNLNCGPKSCTWRDAKDAILALPRRWSNDSEGLDKNLSSLIMPAVSANVLRHGKERKERGSDRSLASIVASRSRDFSVTWSLNNYADIWAQPVCSFCLAEQKQNIKRGEWIGKGRSSSKWKGCIPKNCHVCQRIYSERQLELDASLLLPSNYWWNVILINLRPTDWSEIFGFWTMRSECKKTRMKEEKMKVHPKGDGCEDSIDERSAVS